MKAKYILGSDLYSQKLLLDGVDVSQHVHNMTVTASPDEIPELTVTFFLTESDVDIENANVVINAEPLSEELGKAIYESLKKRYGDA